VEGDGVRFDRVLIANRGEIAVRVTRTCHDLGVEVVAVHSDVDAGARHVAAADHAVLLPGTSPTETYLNVAAIVDAARSAGAVAVHPGYGFLSERADAAEAVLAAGLAWIGPPPSALRASGDKVQARRLAGSVGVASVPGTLEPVTDTRAILAFAEAHGYPVAIKAAAGGGGRGLRVALSAEDVPGAMESAAREAIAAFGSGDVYLERYLTRTKHVEIQILSSRPGEATWLGARDCSTQRRHQKLVEETPPLMVAELVPAMGDAAVAVANACGYVNAGTVEFLLDLDEARFFFLEINARLQVEHTITEEVLGVDLVAAQLRIAAGDDAGITQGDVMPGGRFEPRGHAMECRINAEDPARGFVPGPGRLTVYREPGGPGVRVDSGFGEGDVIPGAYDSLIAKLIVRAGTRDETRRRMLRALAEFRIEGVPTTIPAHCLLLEDPAFVDGSYTTTFVEGGALDALMSATVAPAGDTASPAVMVGGMPAWLWNPAIGRSVTPAAVGGAAGRGTVVAPMHGTLLEVLVETGDVIEAGDAVAVLEAMKMETQITTAVGGTVKEVRADAGAVVEAGEPIAVLG
jgi:acetyl-CoA/propionyl-CoA carboxylase biotin carboxyl carrier protein